MDTRSAAHGGGMTGMAPAAPEPPRDAAQPQSHDAGRITQLERELAAARAGEAAFRTIVATTADALVLVDADGRISYLNPAAERLLGRSADELVGEPFGFPLVIGETTEVEVLRDGTPVVAELRVADTTWDERPARIASLRDITERRHAEAQARSLIREQAARAQAEAGERTARFLADATSLLAGSLAVPPTLDALAQLAVSALADCCVIELYDQRGRVRRRAVACADPQLRAPAAAAAAPQPHPPAVQHAAPPSVAPHARLIESLDAALLQRSFGDSDATRPLRARPWRGALTAPLVSRARTLGSITLLREHGRQPFLPADLALVAELASRAAVAIDNARLYRDAQAANVAKAEFLAVMSHELRTPLNAIIGYTDLLLLGVPDTLPPATTDHVERIRSSARHLLSLIEEILSFARVEAGRDEVRIVAVDAARLLDDVLGLNRPLAQQKNLQLVTRLPDRLPTIHSEPGKLRQILVNLISNAIKFTDDGHVEIAVDTSADTISFRVADTGCGIDAEHFDDIFQPFWQAEQSKTRRAEGTGLGLAVARRLARLLGGDVSVQSEPGEGSTFNLTIPIRTAS